MNETLLGFLANNHVTSRDNEAAFSIHPLGFGPFKRLLVFCWHESIGAKYWVVKSYEDALRIGERHLEVGEDHARKG